MVENAEQAALAVKWSKYAPLGRRGCGPLRAEYTHRANEYFDQANDWITVVAQMESLESVRNIEEIVRVPGLDAVFMGLDDLRQSMGLLGVRDHPDLDERVEEIFRAAREAGMAFGTFVDSAEVCRSWDRSGRQAHDSGLGPGVLAARPGSGNGTLEGAGPVRPRILTPFPGRPSPPSAVCTHKPFTWGQSRY